MDAKLKRKWIKALRSGDFRRGTIALCAAGKPGEGDKFCCLGVLAYVQNVEWIDDDKYGLLPELPGGGVNDIVGYLQEGLAAGLTKEQQRILAKMNDSGKSFSKIADYIEANL